MKIQRTCQIFEQETGMCKKPVLLQASPQKSLDSQTKFTRSEKNSLDLKFLRRNSQFCLK